MRYVKDFFKYAFHVLGIGSVGSLVFIGLLAFYRISTQGYAYFVEDNLLIRNFENVWVCYSVVYLTYVFLMYYKRSKWFLGGEVNGKQH